MLTDEWVEITLLLDGVKKLYRYSQLSIDNYPHAVEAWEDDVEIGWITCPNIGIAIRIQREIPLLGKASNPDVIRFELRVTYKRTTWSRDAAWTHLMSNPPTITMEGKQYVPLFRKHVNNSDMSFHPYRKNHCAVFWGYDVEAWEEKT